MSFAAAHESKRVSQACHTCRDRSPSRGRFGAARKARFGRVARGRTTHMQRIGDAIVSSPSDLHYFLECEPLTQLDLARVPGATRHARDAHADHLATKGLEHGHACLDRFRDQSHPSIGPSSTGEFL